jgi:hypothetical protein
MERNSCIGARTTISVRHFGRRRQRWRQSAHIGGVTTTMATLTTARLAMTHARISARHQILGGLLRQSGHVWNTTMAGDP